MRQPGPSPAFPSLRIRSPCWRQDRCFYSKGDLSWLFTLPRLRSKRQRVMSSVLNRQPRPSLNAGSFLALNRRYTVVGWTRRTCATSPTVRSLVEDGNPVVVNASESLCNPFDAMTPLWQSTAGSHRLPHRTRKDPLVRARLEDISDVSPPFPQVSLSSTAVTPPQSTYSSPERLLIVRICLGSLRTVLELSRIDIRLGLVDLC